MAAMISSRGRYALRVMTDLAGQDPGRLVPLKEIAARQGISQKYLEAIMTALSKGGLVDGQHGKGGGYRLLRKPAEYSLGEILRGSKGAGAGGLRESSRDSDQHRSQQRIRGKGSAGTLRRADAGGAGGKRPGARPDAGEGTF